MLLRKYARSIGPKGEFLEKDGSPLAFNVSEYLTEDFIYFLRKKAILSIQPKEILQLIIEHIESYGICKRGRSREEEHKLVMCVASMFCFIFGVNIIDAKLIVILEPSINNSLVKHEVFFNGELIPLINLYRDEWEILVQQYEAKRIKR